MTQTTSADTAQGVAVLGLPELARTLAEAGLHVVTGETFRAAASAANAQLKVAPIPMVMADVLPPGTKTWVEKVVRSCPVVFVALDLAEGQKRVTGNTSSATRLTAPVLVDDVLAAVGLPSLGTGAQLLADGSVTEGTALPSTPTIADPAYWEDPANVPTSTPRAAPTPPAPAPDPQDLSELDEFTFGQQEVTPLPVPAPLPPTPAVPVTEPAPQAVAEPEAAPRPPAAPAVPAAAPPAPAFDFWGSAPAVPPVAPVPAPVAPAAQVPPTPAASLWGDTPAPVAPAPVADPAPWAPPPARQPAPTQQFGVPAPTAAAAPDLEHLDALEQDLVPAPVVEPVAPIPTPAVETVTPLPPVPAVPVPPVDQPIDRVPPVPVAPAITQPRPVVGEQIGVETGFSPALGRQLAPCIFTVAGKGGVGKTSIAMALAQRAAVVGGLRTVLVDGNRGQGDLRTYLSLTRSGLPTIYDAVTTGDPSAAIVTPDRLNANRPDGAEELAIALVQAPPRGLTDPATITSALYHDVITAARGAADLVVIDTQIVEGSERGMFDELTIPMLAAHAYGVGIADLSRPGVDNLIAHLSEFIAQGVPVERLMTMLNRVPATTEFDLQRTSDALSRYGAFLAAVPADPEVHSSMAYGTSIQDNPVLAPVLDAALMRATANPVFAQTGHGPDLTAGGVPAPRKRGLFRRGRG